MADTKLSALTELAATPANDDEVYIRDISEAAAAESKRITVTNLMAAASQTKEFFVPVHFIYTNALATPWGDFPVVSMDATGEIVYFSLKAPHDFIALTHCKVIGMKGTNGTIDWTATTDFAAIGEVYTTHSDSDTGDGLSMTASEIEEVDISAAFTGLAADDFVGVKFTMDAISAGDYKVIGLVFKYS